MSWPKQKCRNGTLIRFPTGAISKEGKSVHVAQQTLHGAPDFKIHNFKCRCMNIIYVISFFPSGVTPDYISEAYHITLSMTYYCGHRMWWTILFQQRRTNIQLIVGKAINSIKGSIQNFELGYRIRDFKVIWKNPMGICFR